MSKISCVKISIFGKRIYERVMFQKRKKLKIFWGEPIHRVGGRIIRVPPEGIWQQIGESIFGRRGRGKQMRCH